MTSPLDETMNDEEFFEENDETIFEEKKPSKAVKPKPLKNKWRFWHEKLTAQESWKNFDHLSDLCEFGTIQEFWSCFNNIPAISVLKVKESFHLMKNLNDSSDSKKLSIVPAWEDPYNVNGGEWVFRTPKEAADVIWRELVLAVIGEQYHGVLQPGDEICGLSVSQRPTDQIFKIWNKQVGSEADQKKIFERTKEILQIQFEKPMDQIITTPYYKKHKE